MLPHTATPVAFVSTEDQSDGLHIQCSLLNFQEIGRGIRWGFKLAQYLEELLP